MRASGRGFACHWTCCEASALGCTCACYDEGICCEEVFGSSPQAFHCLSALEGISPGHHAVSAHIVVRTGMSRRQSIDMYVCASTSTVHACRCLLPQWPCPSTWACRPASPQDRPGFLVNRMLLPLINEAFFLLMEVSTRGHSPATLCKLLPAWLVCDSQALQKLSQLVFRSCLDLSSILASLCFLAYV